ncbi:phage tail protein, partial [Pseudomonas syringae pv. actinidifoliorum]|nr:phage tail protein [Pseudomonas syringae pv. actinidifoliorum]
WCLKKIQEDQSALMQGGIPRKQAFTLEFTRYGDDMQNV